MSTIDQNLLDRLVSKLDVSKQRVYQLIQEISHRNHVRRHIGALLLAGDHGISVQKYARAEDLNELRGIPNHVQVHVPSEAASPASSRKKKSQSIPKTKENTVFVVHGRDTALRNAMYEFLGALGLRVQEWGHAIRAARGHGGNPYVGDAVFKIIGERSSDRRHVIAGR